MASARVLVLDFGSQTTQLIARRIREAQVFSEVVPSDVSLEFIRDYAPSAIVLSGGPASVHEVGSPRACAGIFELGIPILGICYGMQTMAAQLGGTVTPADKREFGHAELRARGHSALFESIQDRSNDAGHGLLDVWMSHGDEVAMMPTGFTAIGSTSTTVVAAMADEARKLYGVQFHPEVAHTKQGAAILEQFLFRIAGCEASWTMASYVDKAVAAIRAEVGNGKVVLGLSGGVDSSVAALLLQKAIGDRLTCVFVDNGLLRLHEANEVPALFQGKFGLKLMVERAADEFLGALQGVSDPEAKRKTIGKVFVDVFQRVAQRIPGVTHLGQGTIYPDVIESAAAKSGKAKVIKSHHNVGGLPASLALKLVEPLRDLFKDEVRALGLTLGLPRALLYRHPFPGPGLGVRILGEITERAVDLLQRADAIFLEELERSGHYATTSQAFAVFLPVKSVGVMGDGRTYENVVALRAVTTVDFMTAEWARLPYDLLATVSNRIINEVRGINRVVYDISGKPPATIEWE
jgi:GMP synthase (glutamine-hydrolysing)